MTWSTSEVAVCCSSDSRSSLSNRAFSMAMMAWAAKILHDLDLLIGERPHLLAVDDDNSDHLVVSEQGHANKAPGMREFDRCYARFVPVRRFGGDVGYLIGLLRDRAGPKSRVYTTYRLAEQKLRPLRGSAMGAPRR